MTYYPIVQFNDRPGAVVSNRRLPAFYMQDFTILGFRVSDYDRAIQILDRRGFLLKQEDGMVAVHLSTAVQMNDVMQLFSNDGLACEIADLAEGMYQG